MTTVAARVHHTILQKSPKVSDKRSLRGYVCVLLPVAINVVSIDVVAACNALKLSKKDGNWELEPE